MGKLVNQIEELGRILRKNEYRFEIDTEDVVFGLKKTLVKRTRDLTKAIKIRAKTISDVGRYISPSVRILEVRWYTNGELTKTLNALITN